MNPQTDQTDVVHKADEGEKSFAQAAEESELSLAAEFLLFLREHKAWWMVPILLALSLIFLAAWFGGGPLAPFIYPLF